ncbi:MAG: hypothetical protein A3K19_11030 [Lentisphaerae bacterium RIFOXYB12_FULL_65_16]|nr:MAG: hypothetical protein A3K18_15100 [Lentisphaerae bacterium RIFOXYA12_64_32]OGV94363.1 MAG: hypothetical protein A3K19_11030 [Lentisphaerae bacterium RIFOXYB12_FULL_65_16]
MSKVYSTKQVLPPERIERAILFVRGHKVMLDRDLAVLYGVETRVLNQAVRRNARRFPPDFMFELERDEIARISQFVTSSPNLRFSKRVCAFTEQGVAMLSGVLNSDRAVEVNIAIMRAFVRLRELLASNAELAHKLDELEAKYDAQFQAVFEAIRQLMAPPDPPRRRIGFGEIREAPGHYEPLCLAAGGSTVSYATAEEDASR